MTWSAPSERTRSALPPLHTPVTSAPSDLASCTAKLPTPPEAPMTRTRCPCWTRPWVAHPLEGGQGGQGDGRRLLEAQVGRLRPQGRLRDAGLLGEGAGQDVGVHLVAGAEPGD